MKTTITLKEFSALSFNAGPITHAPAPAIPEPSPQPAPVNVRDFTVQHDGLADVVSPRSRVPARNELNGNQRLKHKVLLLDDTNGSLLRSLGNSFSAETYEVVLAESAQEAIDKSDAVEIDLLLVKLDSQKDEGWDAINEITVENPFLPIIVITRQPELRNRAEAAGACALVEMPVDVPTLLQTIRELLAEPTESRMERVFNRPTGFRQIPPAGGSLRDHLDRRHTTPYRFNTPVSRFGLNE